MPTISGTVQDIGGNKMDPKEVELLFYPNEALIGAAAPRMGFVYPPEPVSVKPDPSTGEFSVVLADTTLMLGDAFYRLQIRWLHEYVDGEGKKKGTSLLDFPDWKIRPGSRDSTLAEAIGGGQGHVNPNIWWCGLVPPPSQGYMWLYLDPDNPDGEVDPIPDLDLGDVVIGGW